VASALGLGGVEVLRNSLQALIENPVLTYLLNLWIAFNDAVEKAGEVQDDFVEKRRAAAVA
jgi:hypothetical protein